MVANQTAYEIGGLAETLFFEFRRHVESTAIEMADKGTLDDQIIAEEAVTAETITTTQYYKPVTTNAANIKSSSQLTVTHLRRTFNINNKSFDVNTGHAYFRVHKAGSVANFGNVNEIETKILNDALYRINQGQNLLYGPNGPKTFDIYVNGNRMVYEIFYDTTHNIYRISNYYPPK